MVLLQSKRKLAAAHRIIQALLLRLRSNGPRSHIQRSGLHDNNATLSDKINKIGRTQNSPTQPKPVLRFYVGNATKNVGKLECSVLHIPHMIPLKDHIEYEM